MVRGRLVRYRPYAVAIGVVAVLIAVLLVLERQALPDIWTRAWGWVEAYWQRGLGQGPG